MTKTLGFVFIGIALILLTIGGLYLFSGIAARQLQLSGAILGLSILLIVIVLPLLIIGFLSIMKERKDVLEDKYSADLRRILDMVSTRGAVDVSDIVIELGSTIENVRTMIYKLVGMELFNGYINWDEGKLYSVEAAGLVNLTSCKNCGGQIKLAGKGVSKCPYCGTEYYLAREKSDV